MSYVYNKRYNERQYVDILVNYHNGDTYNETEVCCCEIVKKNTLSVKEYIITKRQKCAYSDEEITKWLGLLKENGIHINYEINKEGLHQIRLIPTEYQNIMHMYICLILTRYLWYVENDGLIDRIFDILKNSNLSFWQAVVLAHYYDNLERDVTFNLAYNYTFFADTTFFNFDKLMTSLYNIRYLNDFVLFSSLGSGQGEIDLKPYNIAKLGSSLLWFKVIKYIQAGNSYNNVCKFITNIKKNFLFYIDRIQNDDDKLLELLSSMTRSAGYQLSFTEVPLNQLNREDNYFIFNSINEQFVYKHNNYFMKFQNQDDVYIEFRKPNGGSYYTRKNVKVYKIIDKNENQKF